MLLIDANSFSNELYPRIYVSDDDITYWEEQSVVPSLKINKTRDVVRIFVNGQLSGNIIWTSMNFWIFHDGDNTFPDLLSYICLEN